MISTTHVVSDPALGPVERSRISRSLRFQVLRRDGYQCRYCGAAAGDTKLTIDHVVPATLGGSDEPANLVTACFDCNSGKAATPPDAPVVEEVREDAERWAAAMQRAAEEARREAATERAQLAAFDAHWLSYSAQGRGWKTDLPVPRDPNWRNSILGFTAAGLDDIEIIEAVDIAMSNNKLAVGKIWRYFCGICWRKIGQLQQRAAELLQEDDDQARPWPAERDDETDGGNAALEVVA